MTPTRSAAKPFAWAGIALSIPSQWDIGRIGNGYALLESGSRPVLEFKTAPIRGRFSFDRHMKRLSAARRRGKGPAIAWAAPPEDWPTFPGAEVRAFRWQGTRIGGRGLLHYCRACRKATILQFYEQAGTDTAVIPAILASFRDHTDTDVSRVAVYDIEATLPGDMALIAFQFDAGRFELVFGRSRERVTLWRFSPADVLLQRCGRDLAEIAGAHALLPPAAPGEADCRIDGALEWRWRPAGLRDRLKHIVMRRLCEPVHILRLWHLPQTNRILAVRADGLDRYETFERVCASYGVI